MSLDLSFRFILMHLANYPGNPNMTLYLFLIFGVNLPLAVSCARHYIVVPTKPRERSFVIIYDIVIKKP
jgi:hypothetical protein